MNPIFIIGTERSGTNLMRLILNSHSNIFIPHPPHILKNFFKLEPLYSNLTNDENFKQLIHDVVRTIELHPYPWQIEIDKEKVFRTVKERNLINIFFAIYNLYLEATGKKRWGCKSTFMINHVALIRHYYPSSKFIYMVRDGREVAASAKKTIYNHYHIYYIARLWKKEQQTGIYWLNKLSAKDIYLIRYEDILKNPINSIKSLCSFLEEPYQENMLNFFKTDEAKKCASICPSWANTDKPIKKDNYEKYKTELNPSEIALFESIAAPELDWFSYQLTTPFYLSESACARGANVKIIYFLEEFFFMLYVQIKYYIYNNSIQRRSCHKRYKKFWFLKLTRIIRIIK